PLDMPVTSHSSVAPMQLPDLQYSSHSHFRPVGAPCDQPLGVFAALRNAKEILEGRWAGRAYEVAKKGQSRSYRIARPPAEWPTRFVRPPGIHVRFDALTVDGESAHGLMVVATLWVLNNFVALTSAGTGV